jgi:hypothetical protein
MAMSLTSGASRRRGARGATVLLLAGLLAAGAGVTMCVDDGAYADPGNGKGGGNGGGNAGGNGGGNAGGNGKGGGNGNGNAGGNGKSNAGGNSATNSSGAASVSGAAPATEIVDPQAVLSLREAGVIQPLDVVYNTAERQLAGKVIDAKLMADDQHRLTYDLRVVTEAGHVRRARYDAATLALLSVDDRPVE